MFILAAPVMYVNTLCNGSYPSKNTDEKLQKYPHLHHIYQTAYKQVITWVLKGRYLHYLYYVGIYLYLFTLPSSYKCETKRGLYATKYRIHLPTITNSFLLIYRLRYKVINIGNHCRRKCSFVL